MPEREQRVTPLELFFDLVFVFGITQVTSLMSADPTWTGLGRGLLVLAAIWWASTGDAWLTNTLEPEASAVRVAMVGAMASILVVALAVPGAFGDDGVLFAVAYLVMRLLFLLLYALAGGALIGRGEGWRVTPAHLAERHSLIVIIVLGESIISIGIGATDVTLTPGVVTAGVLGVVALAALWWAYFDVYAVMGERQLAAARGAERVRFARDHYSYLHLPMIAGVVLFALGLKKTIEHVGDPLDTVPAVALCGGVALYFFVHVVMRLRSVQAIRRTGAGSPGWFGVGRPVATLAALALVPAALELAALAALALVTAVCVALIVYDVVHYRDERARVRETRP